MMTTMTTTSTTPPPTVPPTIGASALAGDEVAVLTFPNKPRQSFNIGNKNEYKGLSNISHEWVSEAV